MSRIETLAEGVTLYLGDSREILPTLPAIDCLVTSPPYGQQRDYGKKIDNWADVVSVIGETPAHDKTQILVNLGLIHRDGSVIPYWEPFHHAMMNTHGWRFFGWYVWDQLSGMAGDWNGRLAPSFEFVFHFNRAARAVNKTKPTLGGRQHSGNLRQANGVSKAKSHDGKLVQPTKIPDSVIRTVRETSNGYEAEHPARFPVSLATELIAPFSDPGDVICDPFLGSGTTGVAAVKLGRQFVGIELEPKYFDISCRRVSDALKQPDMFIERPAPAQQEALEI